MPSQGIKWGSSLVTSISSFSRRLIPVMLTPAKSKATCPEGGQGTRRDCRLHLSPGSSGEELGGFGYGSRIPSTPIVCSIPPSSPKETHLTLHAASTTSRASTTPGASSSTTSPRTTSSSSSLIRIRGTPSGTGNPQPPTRSAPSPRSTMYATPLVSTAGSTPPSRQGVPSTCSIRTINQSWRTPEAPFRSTQSS